MLEYLNIQNLAVISSSEIEFSKGLNIITGETGAGKSMIVQALGLLKGSRASKDWVRTGKDRAIIQAVLDISDYENIQNNLELNDFEPDFSLNIERIIKKKGNGRVKINGSLVPARTLQDIISDSVEISSQHDQQKLLSRKNYLILLDLFGNHRELLVEYRHHLEIMDAKYNKLEKLKRENANREEKIHTLKFKIKEIEKLKIKPGERKKLLRKRKRLKARKEILETVYFSERQLYSKDDSITDLLHEIIRRIENVEEVEPGFASIGSMLQEALVLVEESCSELSRLNQFDQDGGSLEEIENRLHSIERLLRKYSLEDASQLLAKLDKLKKELEFFDNFNFNYSNQEKACQKAQKTVVDLAEKLSINRKKQAKVLANTVQKELSDLDFKNAVFKIKLTSLSPQENTPGYRIHHNKFLSGSGTDQTEFLFSPNPGEKPLPISKAASGGELSRLHLALKCALETGDQTITTVYDEVDSGIGGSAAVKIAEKLKQAGKNRQVICITHLPQIAAFADCHFVVYKDVKENRTYTRIRKLDKPGRIEELARMTGKINKESRQHARALLDITQ
ncbi:MAG: DNA repair protein RecN [Deltaproteobacteria bacterium]|jgi:DNA repair protein RecN (Recombination protein N)|nr:DNA repair protein RecN [Deltaproteobacteria bacterium]